MLCYGHAGRHPGRHETEASDREGYVTCWSSYATCVGPAMVTCWSVYSRVLTVGPYLLVRQLTLVGHREPIATHTGWHRLLPS
jgi:hypothetical protein